MLINVYAFLSKVWTESLGSKPPSSLAPGIFSWSINKHINKHLHAVRIDKTIDYHPAITEATMHMPHFPA